MAKQFQNLFPTDIRQAAGVLFGFKSMQPVLLKLQQVVHEDSGLLEEDSPRKKLLNPNEIETLKRYKLLKRRSEYLTGRICAKMAIDNYLTHTEPSTTPVALTDIEIYAKKDGRPFVHFHQPRRPQPVIDISISHSGAYGVALASESTCGIDIQQQAETLLGVKNRYCTTIECSLLKDILPDDELLTRLTLLWAAKEAAKKALSYWWMPGFLDLEVTGLEQKFTRCIGLSLTVKRSDDRQVPHKIAVVTGTFRNYGLAICLINKDQNDA